MGQIMLETRLGQDRGVADLGWLYSRHTFSFGDYYDPRHVGFGPLLVINEDRVAAGQGFGRHSHRDMEIISYVLEGRLEHQDSMGNGSVIGYGDVQRMSAGSGVQHSEFNHSKTDGVHFLQIWIQPDAAGIKPGYEEKRFEPETKAGAWRLIASPDGRDGSVLVHQDAFVYASILGPEDQLERPLQAGRLGYLHVARGQVAANGLVLSAGDGLKVAGEPGIVLEQARDAETLWFDLPG